MSGALLVSHLQVEKQQRVALPHRQRQASRPETGDRQVQPPGARGSKRPGEKQP